VSRNKVINGTAGTLLPTELNKRKSRKVWSASRISTGERVFQKFNILILFVLGVLTLFPFYITFINSISPARDYYVNDIIMWPSRFETSYYKLIFSKGYGLLKAYRVSIFLLIVGTGTSMLVTIPTSYALAQKKLPYRTGITLFIVFTIYFGGGLIPTYLLVRALGLLNTTAAMILPSVVSTGIMLLLRNFFMTIPGELIDAARIDGCSELRAIPLVIIPLSMPAIATFTLFYGVQYWNTFFSAVIYISDPDKQPLQVFLRMLIWESSARAQDMERFLQDGIEPPTEALKAAAIMATTLPIIFLYPFLQKYFMKGIVVGSLKG
jgi:putative aldouronate transport system permease protein